MSVVDFAGGVCGEAGPDPRANVWASMADAAPDKAAAMAALVRRKSLLVVFDMGVACSDPALG